MRDHPVFKGPLPVPASKLVSKKTPEAWRTAIKEKEVSVLPLVEDIEGEHKSGWISYRSMLVDSPEVEILSGGLSERDMDGGAIWRQGHLLHFAFDISPSEMNDTGRALLLNCIAYIARFTEDRPIARTPSGWAENEASPKSRRWIEGLFATGAANDKNLDFYLTPATKAQVSKMTKESYTTWFKENVAFITCDRTGKLMVDSTAKELNVPFDQPEFLPEAIAKLRGEGTATAARELLKRYAPDGPGEGSADQWSSWWETNKPFLFYSERGWFRWYIDPLAKKRGVPSEKLRGPARASKD